MASFGREIAFAVVCVLVVMSVTSIPSGAAASTKPTAEIDLHDDEDVGYCRLDSSVDPGDHDRITVDVDSETYTVERSTLIGLGSVPKGATVNVYAVDFDSGRIEMLVDGRVSSACEVVR